jgi:hypothetical protein
MTRNSIRSRRSAMLATCIQFLRRIDWLFVAVFALMGYLLFPLLSTGYWGDDIINSLIHGVGCVHGKSLPELIAEVALGWMGNGRFYPLAYAEVYTVFSVFKSLLAYKTFVLTSVLVNLLLAYGFVRQAASGVGQAVLAGAVGAQLCRRQPDLRDRLLA